MKKGEIYREKVNSEQGYEDWKFTGDTAQTPDGTEYAMENDRGVYWFDEKAIKALFRLTKNRGRVMRREKKKNDLHPNPFGGAGVQDIYLTKNKIAVTTVKEQRRNNVNKTIVKTKYYALNDSNKRSLRRVRKEVRRGRNGSKYETL